MRRDALFATTDSVPFAHLSFSVACVPVAGDGGARDMAAALAHANALLRKQQLQNWTVNFQMPSNAKDKCPMNRMLPADTDIWVAKDISVTSDDDASSNETTSERIRVAKSVAARRHFGRHMRQKFYAFELGEAKEGASDLRRRHPKIGDLTFTNSLQDIVAEPPDLGDGRQLPLQLHNKIAVFYADGNAFGSIRAKLGGGCETPESIGKFSEQLLGIRRAQYLFPLLDRLWRGSEPEQHRRMFVQMDKGERKIDALRFEMLLWGGDEMMWVAPAWLGFWLAQGFFTQLSGAEIEKNRLTHGAGLLICDRKTPIRQAKDMVKTQLADAAKSVRVGDQPVDAIQVEIFESADLPDGQLDRHRASLFEGLWEGEATPTLSLSGANFGQLLGQITKLKDPEKGLPRSQLHRLLDIARRPEAERFREALENYRNGPGSGRDIGDGELDLLKAHTLGTPTQDTLILSLAILSQWWDYVSPFATPLPNWGK
jgi:hypothetical protein